ncbi:MAG: VOC family protein [Deltaproteobacteria bacterium]|nr:VOC family protein [Deltaproteobacteria bacterium]MBW2396135.1 VOC family protein [Deltaproteobacteria bacterium]
MSESSEQWTEGVHHVGLTVPDLEAALRFFTEGLGMKQVGEVLSYPAAFVSDGHVMVTLWRAKDPENATPFDRQQGIGLHHLSLQVAEATRLDALHERLAAWEDVEIEFAPEPLGGGPTRHMMCAIPGGIRVEFIAPASS